MGSSGNQRWDAKKITMRKPDFRDYDLHPDEEFEYEWSNYRATHRATSERGGRGRYSSKNYLENRRERQIYRGAGGSSTSVVIMNLIRVPKGAMIGKDFILRCIGQYVDDVKPLLLKLDRKDVIFFIEDNETAAAIRAISRRVRDPRTNEAITFIVSRASAGYTSITASERDLIKQALKKRYDPENHALNLSEFGLDDLFRTNALHLSLNRNNIMMAVVEIIDENYGDVTALSMKGNRLRFLDFFACLLYRIKNVKTLDLSANQIERVSELEKLQGWPVETLYFEGNPLCNTFSSAQDYLSAIHHIFPTVAMLDGVAVQKKSSSSVRELDDETSMPKNRPSFYGTDERRALVEAFIVEYINTYDDPDTNNRKNLINAYDENATFSLSIENLPDVGEKKPYSQDSDTFTIYRRSSHNVFYMQRWERYREKVIHKGAMDIIVVLRKLPPTKHLMDTFIVDISMITEKHMCFAVQGFFHDGLDEASISESYKYFCRNFVVANKGEGKIAVVSDILFISDVFIERVQRYKSMLTSLIKTADSEANATSSISATVSSMSVEDNAVQSGSSAIVQRTPAEIAASGDEQMQLQMVEAFCKESKMKPEWSRKCLVDQNWDYQKAGEAFLAVRDKIPSEAFQ